MAGPEPRLESSITKHLAPVLRTLGYKGSGRTFRRIREGFIEIVNVQGSRFGGMFAVNLAIHPFGVRALTDGVTEKNINEAHCGFRQRLSESGGDWWWGFGATQESMDAAVIEAARLYQSHGERLFERVGGPASPLHTLTPENLSTANDVLAGFAWMRVHAALILMRWRLQQGRTDEAKAFARSEIRNMRDDFFWRQEFESTLAQ